MLFGVEYCHNWPSTKTTILTTILLTTHYHYINSGLDITLTDHDCVHLPDNDPLGHGAFLETFLSTSQDDTATRSSVISQVHRTMLDAHPYASDNAATELLEILQTMDTKVSLPWVRVHAAPAMGSSAAGAPHSILFKCINLFHSHRSLSHSHPPRERHGST